MSYRIAELMEAIEASQDATEKERLKTECADLVCRLWSQRGTWPSGSPLSNLKELIEALQRQDEVNRRQSDLPATSYLLLMAELGKIAKEESDLCIDAELAGIDLETERSYLAEHRQELSEDEISVLEWALARRERMESSIRFNGEQLDLINISPGQRAERVVCRLRKLCEQRASTISTFESAAKSNPQD